MVVLKLLHNSKRWLQVQLQLVAPEVVSNPTPADLRKGLARLARQIAESAKSLVRWMDGTCIEAPEIQGPMEEDEPFVYTWASETLLRP